MKLIDIDALPQDRVEWDDIVNAPTIKTKQIKYYDEDESVWKIGEVVIESN